MPGAVDLSCVWMILVVCSVFYHIYAARLQTEPSRRPHAVWNIQNLSQSWARLAGAYGRSRGQIHADEFSFVRAELKINHSWHAQINIDGRSFRFWYKTDWCLHGWRSLSRCWAVKGGVGEYIIWKKKKRHGVESLAEISSNPGCFHGLSSFPELGGTVCRSCQQINIYISCSPIQRVQKPKEETTIIDLRECQHCCWFLLFLYAYKINIILDVTISTYESQFYPLPLVFEDFRIWS